MNLEEKKFLVTLFSIGMGMISFWNAMLVNTIVGRGVNFNYASFMTFGIIFVIIVIWYNLRSGKP